MKNGQKQSLDDIDLSHKRTRDRVRTCLSGIDLNGTYVREDLDRLCGQPNKPLGRILRRNLFVRKIEITAMRNGEQIEYRPLIPAIAELQTLLQEHDVAVATKEAEEQSIERDTELGREAHRKMFPHRS